MSFKIYKNRITKHASISTRQKDKSRWYNLPMSHTKPKDSYIEISDPHPKAKIEDKSYIRKYMRIDKKSIRGMRYKNYHISRVDEEKIQNYLKNKYKKR